MLHCINYVSSARGAIRLFLEGKVTWLVTGFSEKVNQLCTGHHSGRARSGRLCSGFPRSPVLSLSACGLE